MMELTWQQIQALSSFILNPSVKKVRLQYGWTTKHRGYKSLFATIYTEGKPQMVYQLQKKRVAPKRWRKPVEWVGEVL